MRSNHLARSPDAAIFLALLITTHCFRQMRNLIPIMPIDVFAINAKRDEIHTCENESQMNASSM